MSIILIIGKKCVPLHNNFFLHSDSQKVHLKHGKTKSAVCTAGDYALP